ncbi:uncharacterized protein BDV14DRAFT_189062 [Aspergillus stella-maris]|uniref:uncharacterized protein n=1 Tax=Aspergillus stella-maris TaxID=1810926 RepID=UPI003CCDA97A
MPTYFDNLPVLFYALLPALVASISFNLWRYTANLKGQPSVNKNYFEAQATQKLPPGWWTDETRFQTEKRSIFSQARQTLLPIHRDILTLVLTLVSGDYFSTEVAGFRIFLIVGKAGVVRAFHNVCWHRAYPVNKKAEGYNTIGRLAKAPHFDNTPSFKKKENGLFGIRTKVDEKGFLHVNFDGRDEARVGEVPTAVKIGRPVMIYQFSQYLCSWEVTNKHATVAHNDNHDIHKNSFLIETGIVSSEASTPSLEINHVGQLRCSLTTYVYNKRSSPFWFLVTFSPDFASKTTLHCEAYSVKRQQGALNEEIKQACGEQLRLKVQEFERQVDVHLELKTAEGKEINPAAVQTQGSGSSEAERQCGAGGKLDW